MLMAQKELQASVEICDGWSQNQTDLPAVWLKTATCGQTLSTVNAEQDQRLTAIQAEGQEHDWLPI